jgi:hypothetical protein
MHPLFAILVVVLSLSEPLACRLHLQALSRVSPSVDHYLLADGVVITGSVAYAVPEAGTRVLPQRFLCDFPRPADGPAERSAPGSHDHVAGIVALAVVALVIEPAHRIVRSPTILLQFSAPPLLPPPIAGQPLPA